MRLVFLFDYASPYAYLASTQAARLAREAGVALVYHPFLLGALFREIGTPMVPMHAFGEAKQRHHALDLMRWADHWGVALNWPSRFPLRTVDALRLTLLAGGVAADAAPGIPATGAVTRLVDGIHRACWVEDRDPADRAVLGDVLEEAGLDRALLDALDAPETKASLKAHTDAAVEMGVCGAPTFSVDGRLFWGQDRLHFVAAALAGWRAEGEGPSASTAEP
jgi:2-hydroxychromene-2-carboxylate isomerase